MSYRKIIEMYRFNPPRALFFGAAAWVFGLLMFGLYLQHVVGLEPCPMCIVQRYALMAVGLIALAGGIASSAAPPSRAWKYGLVGGMGACALLGGWVAARQTLLQYEARNNPFTECSPGIEYLIEMYGLSDALPFIFKGSGNCASADWTFLGLSIANWSLVNFVALIGLVAFLAWTAKRR